MSNENDAINRSDTTSAEVIEKEASDDNRSQKQRDIYEEGNDEFIMLETDDWATKETIDRKAIDLELEIDDEEYWDSLSHIEEENEMIRDDDSETDEDLFWDSPSEPEENTETDMFEKSDFGRKCESKSESMWDNQHINETIKTIPKSNKDSKKMF